VNLKVHGDHQTKEYKFKLIREHKQQKYIGAHVTVNFKDKGSIQSSPTRIFYRCNMPFELAKTVLSFAI